MAIGPVHCDANAFPEQHKDMDCVGFGVLNCVQEFCLGSLIFETAFARPWSVFGCGGCVQCCGARRGKQGVDQASHRYCDEVLFVQEKPSDFGLFSLHCRDKFLFLERTQHHPIEFAGVGVNLGWNSDHATPLKGISCSEFLHEGTNLDQLRGQRVCVSACICCTISVGSRVTKFVFFCVLCGFFFFC